MVTGRAADISDSDCHWLLATLHWVSGMMGLRRWGHCQHCQHWLLANTGIANHCQSGLWPAPQPPLGSGLLLSALSPASLLTTHDTHHTSRGCDTGGAATWRNFQHHLDFLHQYSIFYLIIVRTYFEWLLRELLKYKVGMLCLMKGNNISRSGSMSKDNGCEIKFNICGYFPASENPREIAEQQVMCQLRKN